MLFPQRKGLKQSMHRSMHVVAFKLSIPQYYYGSNHTFSFDRVNHARMKLRLHESTILKSSVYDYWKNPFVEILPWMVFLAGCCFSNLKHSIKKKNQCYLECHLTQRILLRCFKKTCFFNIFLTTTTITFYDGWI